MENIQTITLNLLTIVTSVHVNSSENGSKILDKTLGAVSSFQQTPGVELQFFYLLNYIKSRLCYNRGPAGLCPRTNLIFNICK